MRAPPMTKARVGSHRPARSRKARTRAGLIMSDSARPAPKRRPTISEGRNGRIGSGPDQVTDGEDGRETNRHEGEGRGDRARGQPGHAADAVAAGAAAAEPGSKPDEHSARDEQRHGGRYVYIRRSYEAGHSEGAERQADEERRRLGPGRALVRDPGGGGD